MSLRLTLLKVLIVVVSAILLFKAINLAQSGNIAEVWSSAYTLNQGDKLTLYLNPVIPHKINYISIQNQEGKGVDSIKVDLSKLLTEKPREWFAGRSYTKAVDFSIKLKPGLYYVNNQFTFSVWDPKADIVIVMPHLYTLCSGNSQTGSFFKPVADNWKGITDSATGIPYTITTLKPGVKIVEPVIVAKVLSKLYPAKKIGFLSDFSLERIKELKPGTCLVFYGNFSFMDAECAISLSDFIQKGGRVVVASSNFMSNRIRRDKDNKHITFYGLNGNDTVKDSVRCAYRFNDERSSLKNYQVIGADYQFADKMLSSYFKFTPAAANFATTFRCDSFKVESVYSTGIPLNKDGQVNTGKIKFDKGIVWATVPCKYKDLSGIGTIGMLEKGAGKVLILPSETWFENENMKQPVLLQLTGKLIDSVLK